ncbi:MAG: 4Fe-4S dicluster domain-containing protein [Anaerolineae bacterium]
MTKAMLIDATLCTACRGCQVACKQWNDLPGEKTTNIGSYQNPLRLSAYTWTHIQMREVEMEGKLHWTFLKRQCMHCLHPACVSACPVGAMQQTPEGIVRYNDERCIGCRYCMTACPFRIPRFEWDKPLGHIRKCHFCFDRRASGQIPACVKTCPSGALAFGERDELIAAAEARLRARPDKYVQHIYGKEEGGGTHVLILAGVPFEYLGLPTLGTQPVAVPRQALAPFEYMGQPVMGKEPVTQLNDELAHYGTPAIAVGVAAILAGMQWYSKRRLQAEAATAGGAKGEKEAQS